VNIIVADEQDDPLPIREVLPLAEHVLRSEGLPEETEVAIVFIDERRMADYNGRFMGRSGPTDVLSFPVTTAVAGVPPRPAGPGVPLPLGDVFIAPSVVRRNAAEHGVAFDDELALMVAHGLLHLLGWDHQTDAEAVAMEAEERRLLAERGRVRP